MKSLLDYINNLVQMPPDICTEIENNFKEENIAAGELLLKQQQYCKKLYFLDTGAVRTFHFQKGKDVTSWFYTEGQFFTSWYSLIAKQPCFDSIEALEDCSVYSIDYIAYNKLMEAHPRFERFGRMMLEEQMAFIDYYSKGYMFLTARERYDMIKEYFPDIEQRVKLGQIASFLGITQETLSRLRAGK